VAGSQNIRHAARVLHAGGLIAYPTEGVFGLGCLPQDHDAVGDILTIKGRDQGKGLILIISDPAQIADWIGLSGETPDLTAADDKPVTWIIPASDNAPMWITGDHDGVAVRLTTHPIAHALCKEADSAIVSTSANITGHAPARNALILRRQFGSLVDYIVPGECGPASGPSEIRHYLTKDVVRPA
jgi:L-threonylcarbamoyladenylate synthase